MIVGITDRNALFEKAVRELYLQVLNQSLYGPDKKVYDQYLDGYNKYVDDRMTVYDTNSPLRIHKIESGPDAGKLLKKSSIRQKNIPKNHFFINLKFFHKPSCTIRHLLQYSGFRK